MTFQPNITVSVIEHFTNSGKSEHSLQLFSNEQKYDSKSSTKDRIEVNSAIDNDNQRGNGNKNSGRSIDNVHENYEIDNISDIEVESSFFFLHLFGRIQHVNVSSLRQGNGPKPKNMTQS